MCQNGEFLRFLQQQAYKDIHSLETMFGPTDPRFVFRTITKATAPSDTPYIDFPDGFHLNGGCVVNICISERPWQRCSRDQGSWQVAHESVHLLDPGLRGGSNFLEEGLAIWFQNEPTFHSDAVKRYIEQNTPPAQNYRDADAWVRACMPQLIPAVKTIRASGVRIGDMTADELAEHLPGADRDILERLCTTFT